MQPSCFDFLVSPNRLREKPRTSGLNAVVDFGLPNEMLKDTLALNGDFVDLVKFSGATAHAHPTDQLRQKIRTLQEYDIVVFMGGSVYECAFARNDKQSVRMMFENARAVGFGAVEISDAHIDLPAKVRQDHISMAKDIGLDVIVEIGSQGDKIRAETLVDEVNLVISQGALLSTVEGVELIHDDEPRHDVIDLLRSRVDLDRILFELPWIAYPGVTAQAQENLKQSLVCELGENVNVANVAFDDVLMLECIRSGIDCPALWAQK